MSNITMSKYYINKDKDKILIKIHKAEGQVVMHIVDVNNDTVSTVCNEDIQNIEWHLINSLRV